MEDATYVSHGWVLLLSKRLMKYGPFAIVGMYSLCETLLSGNNHGKEHQSPHPKAPPS
jgi:hypothetical protein